MPKGKSGIKRGGKGSSGGKSKVSIPVAATIAEANALAVSLGLAKHANFGNADVGIVNDTLQSLAEHRNDFPGLPVLEFVGTMPEYRSYMQDTYGVRVPNYRNYFAVAFNESPRIGSGVAIVLNKKAVSPKEAGTSRENFAYSQSLKYLAIGTVKGAINHEEGHQMDYLVKGSSDSVLRSLYRENYGKETREYSSDGTTKFFTSRMAKSLSQYANTSIQEFIAEGWSEYRSSTSPRPLAKAIGERMMELYRGVSEK